MDPVGAGAAARRVGAAHIDVIQRSHRYAVVWPSVHPKRLRYRWYDQGGDVLDRVPTLAELPQLPGSWVEYLTAPTEQEFTDAAKVSGMGREQPRIGPSSHTREGREALQRACWTVRPAPEGRRNDVLNRVAYALGRLCVAGQVEARGAQLELLTTAGDADPDLDHKAAERTIRSGWYAGVKRDPMTAPERDRARWGLEFRDVVLDSALCPEHEMLLLAIMSFVSAQSCSSYSSLTTLQRRSSMSRTKVLQLLADLVSHDWIVVRKAHFLDGRGRKPNWYLLPRRELVQDIPPHCQRRRAGWRTCAVARQPRWRCRKCLWSCFPGGGTEWRRQQGTTAAARPEPFHLTPGRRGWLPRLPGSPCEPRSARRKDAAIRSPPCVVTSPAKTSRPS